MILDISFIHIFESITLLLVVGKLIQIRKLYRQSLNKKYVISAYSSRKGEARKSSLRSSGQIHDTSVYKKFKENYAQHNLPLPEVTFTEGLPLPEVSFSAADEFGHFPKSKPQTKHKAILNNYIEDFFFESKPEVFHEADVVEFRKYKLDSNAEDEFITVEDEHAEVVRAFESLENNLCIVR